MYYYKQSEEIFLGLTEILRCIKALGKDVIINGGDIYITQYRQTYGSARDIMSAVNQEEVFSLYDFGTSSFGKNAADETAYFCDYIEACHADEMNVYLLEYTDDRKLIKQIKAYCEEKDFQ